jgi:hypothetical protein
MMVEGLGWTFQAIKKAVLCVDQYNLNFEEASLRDGGGRGFQKSCQQIPRQVIVLGQFKTKE